jgi:hypothetical protein
VPSGIDTAAREVQPVKAEAPKEVTVFASSTVRAFLNSR